MEILKEAGMVVVFLFYGSWFSARTTHHRVKMEYELCIREAEMSDASLDVLGLWSVKRSDLLAHEMAS